MLEWNFSGALMLQRGHEVNERGSWDTHAFVSWRGYRKSKEVRLLRQPRGRAVVGSQGRNGQQTLKMEEKRSDE